jgi:hypothetical protein
MLITTFATGQSKVAGLALIPLIVLLPIVTIYIGDPKSLLVALYVISVCIGGALGWVAGDAFAHSSGLGKAVMGAITTVATVGGYFASATLPHEFGTTFNELFIKPLSNPSFQGAVQWGTLSFIILVVFSFLYCLANTSGKSSSATTKARSYGGTNFESTC